MGGDAGDEEDERAETWANADAWYRNLVTLVEPQLTRYSIPYIPNIDIFLNAVGG